MTRPPESSPDSLSAFPELVERFEPIRRVGEGAYGEVHLARHRTLDRPVAIKLLRDPDAREATQRILREAETLAGLHHPNIVRIHESGLVGRRPYIVMEYLEGRPLTELEDVENPLGLMEQVACGLDAIHAAGLVHRDLKPGNIMVTDSGRVVIVDLGLVFIRDRTRITQDEAVVGTRRYLAPEVLRGEEPTPSADWYAWGVVLYQLYEGRAPYQFQDLVAWLGGAPLRPPTFRALPPDSARARLLRRLLSPDPASRPGSRDAILQELTDSRALPAQARSSSDRTRRPPGPNTPGGGHGRARSLPLFAVGLATLLLGYLLQPTSAPPPPSPPTAAAPDDPLDETREAVLRCLAPMLERHRLEDGTVPPALRGGSYLEHEREVVAELLDPRTPMRWRRLFESLAALSARARSLEGSRRRLPEILDRDVIPPLVHLSRDMAMVFAFVNVEALGGSFQGDSPGRLHREQLGVLQERHQEVRQVVSEGCRAVGFLREPATDAERVLRATLEAGVFRGAPRELLESILERLEERLPWRTRLHLVEAGLGLVPGRMDADPVHCDIADRILEEALSALRAPDSPLSPESRASLASMTAMKWLSAVVTCGDAPGTRQFERLEELEGWIEAGGRPAGPTTRLYLTWASMQNTAVAFSGFDGFSNGQRLEAPIRTLDTLYQRLVDTSGR